MEKELNNLIASQTTSGNRISSEDIDRLLSELDINLPDDYVEFLTLFNGCEGSLSEEAYICLWSLNQLKEYNDMYNVEEFAPELFLIGSDGGDTAFGFKRENLTYIKVPFIGLSLEESTFLGNNFKEFMEAINKKP
jgi:hypothetical protein